MSELFDIPETLSPKLAWMRDNNCITMRDMSGWVADFRDPKFNSVSSHDYFMERLGYEGDPSSVGYGNTEDEAILDLCIKTKTPHWTIQ